MLGRVLLGSWRKSAPELHVHVQESHEHFLGMVLGVSDVELEHGMLEGTV